MYSKQIISTANTFSQAPFVSYNAFNKIKNITEDNNKQEYIYGPHQQRSMGEWFTKNTFTGNYTDLINTRGGHPRKYFFTCVEPLLFF